MRSQEFMTLGTALLVPGIALSESQLVSYSFIGVGVLLPIIDVFKLRRKSRMRYDRIGGE